MRLGFSDAPCRFEGDAQVVVRLWVVRTRRERPFESVDGLRQALVAQRDDTKIVVRDREVLVDAQGADRFYLRKGFCCSYSRWRSRISAARSP